MKNISLDDIRRKAIESLGLDNESVDFTANEVIACTIRRAAGLFCPCSARTLISAVMEPLIDIVEDVSSFKDIVENIMDEIIAHGDLLEMFEVNQYNVPGKRKLIYLAPPAFIRRKSGSLILIGVLPDNMSAYPHEIEKHVEYVNHVRFLASNDTEYADVLLELGHIELPIETWTKLPSLETSKQHIDILNQRLDIAPRAGDIPDLLLLDSNKPVKYYRGRWAKLQDQTGRYIARRPQAYGADIWCYVDIDHGIPKNIIDFPLTNNPWRGCDEAWRLQAAIDFERGYPQVFNLRNGPGETTIIDLFSPIPMWGQRRLNAIGEPATPSGCLLSYKIPERELGEEISFLIENLWLAKYEQER